MTRLYGRSVTNQRCYGSAPDGRWKTTTMLSSLKSNGETQCIVYEGGTTKELFEAYISQQLCPTLTAGDVVIMDNLSAHKSPRITKSIEERGAHVLYLPPYSPDLNPIEKMWSKIKSILRHFEARTHEELIKAIKIALEKITPLDAKNWFKSCGYYS